MTGLSFPDCPFSELVAPLLPELDALWWDTSFQQSPYPWEWREAVPDWEAWLFVEIAVKERRSEFFWRPGRLSTLAPLLAFDEWSMLCGFAAAETDLAAIAEAARADLSELVSWPLVGSLFAAP